MTTPRIDAVNFHAMGCAAQVVVVGGNQALARRAAGRVARLESLWSRFRPDSEISCCNAAPGVAVAVSAETVTLVEWPWPVGS